MSIAILDIIVIVVVLLSALLAMVRGFSREVLSVGSWIAAAAVAFFFYKPVIPYVKNYVDNDLIATIAAVSVVFLVTLIVVSFITMRISDFIIDSSIGALDRTLGFIFGAARGALLLVISMLFFNWLVPDNQPDWIADARTKPILDSLGQQLLAALPEDTDELIAIGKEKISGVTGDAPPEGAGNNGTTYQDQDRQQLDNIIQSDGNSN